MKNRVFIKGFGENLRCRGYQFEVGKKYKIDLPKGYKLTEADLCTGNVFHFCDGLSKIHQFYSCSNENNRYCIVKVLGQFCESADKCGSDHIKVVREISGDELLLAKGLVNGNSGLFNSDYYNSGNHNSGNYNSGDYNSGYCNSGNYNSGNHNSGNYNSGYYNSGIFNKTNDSNGVFCNTVPKMCIFNIQTDWTLLEFYNSKYYAAIRSSDFSLTQWIADKESKESGVDSKLVGNTYKEACCRWWDGMTEDNKKIIKEIPNFDIDVFCDITGIDKSKVEVGVE